MESSFDLSMSAYPWLICRCMQHVDGEGRSELNLQETRDIKAAICQLLACTRAR